MYRKTGYLEKAKEYHQLAVKIRPEQLGANHVDVAASYNNLGTVYSDTSDLEKAKESGSFTFYPLTLPPNQAILTPSVKVPFLKKKSPSESVSSRGRNWGGGEVAGCAFSFATGGVAARLLRAWSRLSTRYSATLK